MDERIAFSHSKLVFWSKVFNWLLVKAQRHSYPGKYRLYVWLSAKFPGLCVTHRIESRSFSVPVSEWCHWLESGPEHYYSDEMLPICRFVEGLSLPFMLLDLGADVGCVSSFVKQNCSRLQQVIAVEPNPSAFALLTRNLQQFNVPSSPLNAAVSSDCGRARLIADRQVIGDHEGYIAMDEHGDIPVYSVDALMAEYQRGPYPLLVLKLDVEGQETQAIRGAVNTLKHAEKVVVILEIHPQVLEKNSQSPECLFEEIEKIVDVDWYLPIQGNSVIDRETPFYEQFSVKQYDVLGVSK